jgi:hypothetical protein
VISLNDDSDLVLDILLMPRFMHQRVETAASRSGTACPVAVSIHSSRHTMVQKCVP